MSLCSLRGACSLRTVLFVIIIIIRQVLFIVKGDVIVHVAADGCGLSPHSSTRGFRRCRRGSGRTLCACLSYFFERIAVLFRTRNFHFFIYQLHSACPWIRKGNCGHGLASPRPWSPAEQTGSRQQISRRKRHASCPYWPCRAPSFSG